MIRIEMNEYYQPAMKVMIADDDNVIYALCSAEGQVKKIGELDLYLLSFGYQCWDGTVYNFDENGKVASREFYLKGMYEGMDKPNENAYREYEKKLKPFVQDIEKSLKKIKPILIRYAENQARKNKPKQNFGRNKGNER